MPLTARTSTMKRNSSTIPFQSSRTLTTQQLTILKIIYKFRFVTVGLVASYRKVGVRGTTKVFSILLERKIIARHYNSTYKLLGKPASYYLSGEGMRILKDKGLSERVLHARYKDSHSSELFMQHTLGVFKMALDIRKSFPDRFTIFSQYELSEHDYFPHPLPNMYLKRINDDTTMANEYFIDLIGDTQFFVVKKQIDGYIEHYESSEWQGHNYPTILLIISSKGLQRRVKEYIESLIDNGYLDKDELTIQPVNSRFII